MRSLLLFVVLSIPATQTWAGELDEEQMNVVERCFKLNGMEDDLKAVSLVSIEPIGRDGNADVLLVTDNKSRFLLFVTDNECQITFLIEPLGTVKGRFWPESEALTEAELYDVDSWESHAVLIAREGTKILDVARLPATCSMGGKITLIDLFEGVPSLHIECNTGMGGADFYETTTYYHVLDGQLMMLGAYRTGLSVVDVVEQDERLVERCTYSVSGWVKVLARGDRPSIEVFDTGEDIAEVHGTITSYRYDPDKRRFEETAPGKAHTVEPAVKCEPARE